MELDRHEHFLLLDKRVANLSRRRWLQRAGWAAAVAGLSRVSALAADSVSPAMTQLSSYMSDARNRPLPDDVAEIARHHILDTFAAMISGSQLLPGQAALKFAKNYGGEKVCYGPLLESAVRPDGSGAGEWRSGPLGRDR